MTTREAQDIAHERVVKYCGSRCGALTLARTQKIKSRWLVDFEAPRQKFTPTSDLLLRSPVQVTAIAARAADLTGAKRQDNI